MMQLLISDLQVSYGSVRALRGVTVETSAGSVVALLGANGAGKSTLLRAVSGLVRPAAGRIDLDGTRLDRLPPHAIVRHGVVHVPEGRQVFPDLTVRENLAMGAFLQRDRREIRRSRDDVLAAMPILGDKLDDKARTLSGGQQQMLAIGRALMAHPRALLCDEPSLGLAPLVVREVFTLLERISRTGVAVLIAEQKAPAALRIASHAYVMAMGQIVLSGSPEILLRSDEVRGAYLT